VLPELMQTGPKKKKKKKFTSSMGIIIGIPIRYFETKNKAETRIIWFLKS
jgi:hypothetical protein